MTTSPASLYLSLFRATDPEASAADTEGLTKPAISGTTASIVDAKPSSSMAFAATNSSSLIRDAFVKISSIRAPTVTRLPVPAPDRYR